MSKEIYEALMSKMDSVSWAKNPLFNKIEGFYEEKQSLENAIERLKETLKLIYMGGKQ